ncbi:MAG TPA: hypothetical protein VFT13_07995 [Candidatus Krumholzibacteria bacterium]|nr:hypothetical protein [Candidatus Krumholzibacteria bacterium]
MKRTDVIALASVVALFVAVCAAIGPIHPDRSFVVFRYAENVAAGHGPAYNPGDAPSEGYGGALWLLLCALAAKVGLGLPATAWLLSLACGVAALAVLWTGLRARARLTASLVVSGLAAASGPLAVAAMSGEGAALNALLAVAVFSLLDRAGAGRARWIAAAVAGALLATCGNTLGLVFPVALAIRVCAARGGTTPRAGVAPASAVFLAGVVAFHAWRLRTFGSLVARAPGLEAGRASFADLFVAQPYDMAPFGLFYVILLVVACAGVAASRERATGWLALGAAIAAGMATLATRDPLPGLAGSAALVILLAIPVAHLVDVVPRGNRARALDAVVIASLLVASVGWAMDLRVFARHIRDSHDATLAPLGKWMEQWRSDGSLLCDTPGAVPYYSRWRTTLIARDVPLAEAPDVVMVTSQGQFVADMDDEQTRVAHALADRYRVLAAIRRDWTRDRALILYARNDIPELTDSVMIAFPQGIGTVVRLNR